MHDITINSKQSFVIVTECLLDDGTIVENGWAKDNCEKQHCDNGKLVSKRTFGIFPYCFLLEQYSVILFGTSFW